MKEIKDIMSTHPKVASEDSTVLDIVKQMAKQSVSCVVITEGTKPVGIITERDIINKVIAKEKSPKNMPATDIMSTPVVSVSPNTSFGSVAKLMKDKKIRRVVITENDNLAGIVTQTDITKAAHGIDALNRHISFHMNIQSWVIITIFAFVLLYLAFGVFSG